MARALLAVTIVEILKVQITEQVSNLGTFYVLKCNLFVSKKKVYGTKVAFDKHLKEIICIKLHLWRQSFLTVISSNPNSKLQFNLKKIQ